MKNLFSLNELTVEKIEYLLDLSEKLTDLSEFENIKKITNDKLVCNLFFEPSTRTHYSFEVAQNRLNMKIISFDSVNSSMQKKETFYDTIKTFDSFSLDLLIIRCSENEFWKQFDCEIQTPIINAGDGTSEHPTQSLLDLLTIKKEFSGFSGLTVGIIGDIVNSRVAHTNIETMQRLGIKVLLSGPLEYIPVLNLNDFPNAEYIPFPEILSKCDVVMMLRIQHERHLHKCCLEKSEYNKNYGLNSKNFSLLKRNAIIMHPGPVNRGIEITDELVECEKSRIFEQMKNGVFVRMAVICYLLSKI
ncbi:MAG: aspartate carbamoyltransferase catalytic subunit [Oscillospiraceae bacterium]|jgi:aspartate carbamoyltransferase catalytic subunit|nr:aspartate carbamoyltransferase catalytic subunit [Oscillospiraceae bacterium]